VRRASSLWSFQVWPVWLYTVSIFVLGSLPSPPPGPASLDDKALHLLGFALLAVLSCRALRHSRPDWTLTRVLAGGFLVSVIAGAALELWQAVLTYRSCELLDWVADTWGAALGVAFFAAWARLARSRTAT
jgi:VanZ family protein